MFGIPYKILAIAIGLAIVAGALGLHLFGDKRVRSQLAEAQAALIVSEQRLQVANDTIKAVTIDRDTFAAAKSQAEADRAKIKDDLVLTLAKLGKQKPPTECKAAVKWAVDNRGDLSWEAK